MPPMSERSDTPATQPTGVATTTPFGEPHGQYNDQAEHYVDEQGQYVDPRDHQGPQAEYLLQAEYDQDEQGSHRTHRESFDEFPYEMQAALREFARGAIQQMMDSMVYLALKEQSVSIAQQGQQLSELQGQLGQIEGLLRQLVSPGEGPTRSVSMLRRGESPIVGPGSRSQQSLTPKGNRGGEVTHGHNTSPARVWTSTPHPSGMGGTAQARPAANMAQPAYRVTHNY